MQIRVTEIFEESKDEQEIREKLKAIQEEA